MPYPGFLAHPWWVPLLFVAVLGHISSISTTLYLHRSATHGGVKFHPIAEHFFRFWLWLTTGMKTREWVAVHRKHHAFSDREGDPHSPAVEGFWEIVLGGVFFYRDAVKDEEMLEKYGKGCPDDWVERNVYTRFSSAGLGLMLLIDLYLFGPLVGILAWSATSVWLPILGNIINGIGHALGYRNFTTKDESRNIVPIGIFIGGEELHNNHHADPRSARFRAHWFEFDLGWAYIKTLSALRLANVIYARTQSAREFAVQYYSTAAQRASVAAANARSQVSAVATNARSQVSAAATNARAQVSAAATRASRAASSAAQRASTAAHAAAAAAEAAAEAAAKKASGTEEAHGVS